MNIGLFVLMLHTRRNPPFLEQGNNRVDLEGRKEPTNNPGSILQKRTSERQWLGCALTPELLHGGIQLVSQTLAEQRHCNSNTTFLSLAETELSGEQELNQKKFSLDKALEISHRQELRTI